MILVVRPILKFLSLIVFCFVFGGCAEQNGNYPIWQPTTLTVGITDSTLFRDGSLGHKTGHFGNIGGLVTFSFSLRPTAIVPSSKNKETPSAISKTQN